MTQATSRANADQIEYWNGEVGRRWVRRRATLDRAFAPLTAALLERAAPRPGERVLDVGCGCGTTALALAERVGAGGHVLAVDVSRPMLDHARARAAADGGTRAPVEWLEADAAARGFGPPVDLLVSRFGVMFFDDPAAAFANLRRPEFAVVKRAGIPAPYQQLTHPRRLACAYKPAGRRLSRRRGSAWGWRSGAS